MASTYSKLKIELIGTGDQAGQWGTTTNNNLGSSSAGVYRGLEQAIVGMATISSGFVANSYTLPYTNSNDDQEFRCLVLNITASLSNPSDLIVPAIQKPYIVINSSGQTVTVKVSGQTGVAVPNGAKILLYNTGTDVGTAVTYLTELKLGGNLTMPSAGSINDSNGNELIKFPSAVASAVNELTISNAATGSAPTLSATGNDTNIGITLTPKGTGTITLTANPTLSAGTANGVLYLNGSKVATSGSALTFNGTNLISGTVQASNSGGFYITNNASSDALQVISRSSGTDNIEFGNTGAGTSAPTAYIWATRVGGEQMRLTSTSLYTASGINVGIGTSSPSSILDVQKAGTAAATTDLLELTNSGNAASMTNTGTGILFNQFYYDATTPAVADAGRIAVKTEGNWTSTGSTQDAYMTFETALDGTVAERARITSGGYFKASNDGTYLSSTGTYHEFRQTNNATGVYLTATNASYTGVALVMEISRNTTNNSFYAIQYYNNGAAANKFLVADSGNVTNTNNSYGAISDVKTKQDIVDAASQWDDLKGLRVRKFRYKNDPTAPLQIGLVAQEAETVSPGLIDEHPDYEELEVTDEEGNVKTERQLTGTSTKSIKYSVLYMKAIKALQEAMARIETLEAKVAALEGTQP